MSEYQVSTYAFPVGSILNTAHYSTKEVTMESTSHSNILYTATLLPVGTPVALISGGTEFRPVRRDLIASASYDSSAGETTITLTNSAHPFLIGDVCQGYDGVDGTAASLGAITDIDYDNLELVFSGDVATEGASGYYLDVTETGQGIDAFILLEPCEMYADRGSIDAAVDRTTRAIIHGVVIRDNISQVQDVDLQLHADLFHLIGLDV